MLKKILLAIAFLPTIAFAQSGTISQLSQWISSGSYIKMASTTAGFRIPSLNCTSKTNGGALTADASGFITCTDDDGGAAGSQTPWTANINGATYSLSGVGSLDATSSVITQATSTNLYTANLKLGTLSGILKATNGTAGTASAGTDYESPLTVVSPITRTINALGFDFSTQNTWSGHNIFSSLFATNASSTNATTSNLHITGLSLGDLAVSSTGQVYSHATDTYSGGVSWSNGNVTNTMTAGDGITRNTDDLDCDTASNSVFGCLTSANWITFMNKVGTGSAVTTGELAYWLSGGTLGSVATGTISASLPLSVTASRYAIGGATAFSIADAVADGATKGAASFASADFDSASGVISIDASITRDTELAGLSNSKWATSGTAIIPNVAGTGIIVGASSTLQYFNSASSSITLLALPTVTSAITLTNGNGNVSAYTGTSCTNQFVRSLSALGVATCATVQTTDVASGIALDSELPTGSNPSATIGLTANNGVATTFMRSDATPALGVGITPTWSALHIFDAGFIATASSTAKFLTMDRATSTNATSTNLHISGQLSFNGVNGSTWASFCTAITGGAGLCDGSDDGGAGGGYSLFSTSTVYTSSIFMNAGDSLGLGTSTNRSALSMLALATTTGNHLTMRNGNTTWFQKVNDTGSWFMGTTSGAYATATHSALIVPATGGLIVQGSGSSTLRNGITIESGCFSVNGTCIGSGGTLTGSNASAGRVGFWSSANNINGSDDFFWDNTNKRLGLGTTSPFGRLAVVGEVIASYFTATTTSTSLLPYLSVLSSLTIPSGTAVVADDVGEITHDTSSNMLVVDDYVMGQGIQKLWGATFASTSEAFISGGLVPVPVLFNGYTITDIACKVDSGTSKVLAVEDASANATEDITCGTTVTQDDGSITNATATALEEMYIDFGATSGTVDYVTVSVYGTITRE